MNELLRQSPLCQVGCATLPEDFTCPLPLGGTGQYDWTSRRLHLSRHTGRASTSGRQKPVTRPVTLDRPGLTVSSVRTATGCCVVSTPLLWDLEGVTSTDRTVYLPTFPTTGKTTHTQNLDTRSAVELQCCGGCAGVIGRS